MNVGMERSLLFRFEFGACLAGGTRVPYLQSFNTGLKKRARVISVMLYLVLQYAIFRTSLNNEKILINCKNTLI
jgi:hypothetical protein